MKHRFFSSTPIAFIFAAVIMFIFSCSLTFAGQDEAAVDKVRLDFNAAYNEGNAEAMGRLIDGDSVFMPPGEPDVIGRDNIVARYAKLFAKFNSKFELKQSAIQLCGGWAFMSGNYNRTDTPKTGGAVKKITGHYLFVLKKQTDGAWKIARDIWNVSEEK